MWLSSKNRKRRPQILILQSHLPEICTCDVIAPELMGWCKVTRSSYVMSELQQVINRKNLQEFMFKRRHAVNWRRGWLSWVFCGTIKCVQANSVIVHLIRTWPMPSAFFNQFFTNLIIWWYTLVAFELLITILNKAWVRKKINKSYLTSNPLSTLLCVYATCFKLKTTLPALYEACVFCIILKINSS